MIDWSTCPNQALVSGLQNYVEHGILPGSFLTAALRNDLMGAWRSADITNRAQLGEIVAWMYRELPGHCWSSPDAVDRWIKTHRRQAA